MKLLLYGATDIGYMIASCLHQEHDITIIHAQDEIPQKFQNFDAIIDMIVGRLELIPFLAMLSPDFWELKRKNGNK